MHTGSYIYVDGKHDGAIKHVLITEQFIRIVDNAGTYTPMPKPVHTPMLGHD